MTAVAQAAPPVIAARGLSVGYGEVLTVHRIDLEVARGEIVALLGANGAGKTTTLLGLAGLLKPREGAVEVDGVPTSAPLHLRARGGLALVTQERCVLMGLSLSPDPPSSQG